MDPVSSPTSSSITNSVSTSTIINTLCDFVVARYKEEEATNSFFLFPSNFDGQSENAVDDDKKTQKDDHLALNEKATTASQVSAALFKIHTSRISEMRIVKSIMKNQENNIASFSSSSTATTTTTTSLPSASPVSLLLKEKENTKTFNPYSVALLSPSTLFPEFSHLMERIPSFFSLAHVSSSEISKFSSSTGKNVASYPVVKSEVTAAIAFAKSLFHSTLLGAFITPSLIYANFATWCLLLSPGASAGGGDVIVSNTCSNSATSPSSTSVGYVGVESASVSNVSSSTGNGGSSSGGATLQQKTSKISLVLFALECSQILCESALVTNYDNSKSASTLFSNRLSLQQSLLSSLSATKTPNLNNNNNNKNENSLSYIDELNRVTKSIVQLAVRIQQQVQSALTLAQKNPHHHHHSNNKDDQQNTPQKHKRSISSTLSFFSFGGKSSSSAKENSSNCDDTNGKYQQQQQQPLGFFRGNPITVHDFEDQDSSQILSMLTDSFCRLSFALEKIQEEHSKFVFNNKNISGGASSSSKNFTDGVNELGFVVNLYCLAPAAKNLVQIQKDTMKIVKMSHLW